MGHNRGTSDNSPRTGPNRDRGAGPKIEIRPARPDDARFLSWVILTAGRAHVQRGIWEVVLDRGEEQCLTFLELLTGTKKPHLFHHSCYLVAEAEGRTAAALGGHDPRRLGYPALRKAMPEVLRKLGLTARDDAMNESAVRVLECIPDDVEGAWMIDSVATLPEFRRMGMVDRLLEEIMDKGRQQGYRRAQINIYIGNIPAQRAYEKHGFRILDEKRDAIFEAVIGAPGMTRLVRGL